MKLFLWSKNIKLQILICVDVGCLGRRNWFTKSWSSNQWKLWCQDQWRYSWWSLSSKVFIHLLLTYIDDKIYHIILKNRADRKIQFGHNTLRNPALFDNEFSYQAGLRRNFQRASRFLRGNWLSTFNLYKTRK